VTNALQVRCTDTLLASGNAMAGRLNLTCEEFLHRRHTGVYEKKGFVVNRYKGE